MSDSEAPLTLNGYAVTTPEQGSDTTNIMLWGKSGSGKTTLAVTAPGKKLWVLLDPNGTRTLVKRKDVVVVDLSSKGPEVLNDLRKENPLGIEQFIRANSINTVVFDSATVLNDLALEHAVKFGKFPGATLENPGKGGYGHRGSVVMAVVRNFLRSCNAAGVNFVLCAHEDLPTLNDAGSVMYIGIMLGGKAPEKTGLRLDEIWHVSDTGSEHRIAVRPCRTRTPMKTRLFDADKPEFVWKYNPETDEGMKITDWIDQWKQNGRNKIPLPVIAK